MSEPMKNPPARETQTAKRNYQKEMEKVLDAAVRDGRSSDLISPQLLCAVQQLRAGIFCRSIFRLRCSTTIRIFHPKEEYEARTEEVQRLIRELPAVHPIRFVEGKYDPECYYEAVRGHEKGSGGRRALRYLF